VYLLYHYFVAKIQHFGKNTQGVLTINQPSAILRISNQQTELKMAKLSTKQLIIELQQRIVSDITCTDEQIELLTKLRKSVESAKKNAKRIAKSNNLVNTK
jgi:hypothetical protein